MWKNRTVPTFNGGSPLCPGCGGEYLHQTNTTIYERKEDDEWTTVMKQDGKEMVVTEFPSRDTHNPSYRRHDLVIDFDCEHCGGPHHLAIFQHKGVTYMEWVW